jgi:hypothetical protein
LKAAAGRSLPCRRFEAKKRPGRLEFQIY